MSNKDSVNFNELDFEELLELEEDIFTDRNISENEDSNYLLYENVVKRLTKHADNKANAWIIYPIYQNLEMDYEKESYSDFNNQDGVLRLGNQYFISTTLEDCSGKEFYEWLNYTYPLMKTSKHNEKDYETLESRYKIHNGLWQTLLMFNAATKKL